MDTQKHAPGRLTRGDRDTGVRHAVLADTGRRGSSLPHGLRAFLVVGMLLLSGSLLASCELLGSDPTPTPAPAPAPGSSSGGAESEAVGAPLELPAATVKASEQEARRFAVLVGAGEYLSESWNLTCVKPALAALTDTFTKKLGVPGDAKHVIEVTGRDVSRDILAARLGELRKRLDRVTGKPLVFVYWIGHGWTVDRQLRLFVAGTRWADGTYAPTLAARDFERLLAPIASRATVVTVIEACRIRNTLAPPGPASVVPLSTVTAYSCGKGELAQAPADNKPPAYTRFLVQALNKYAARARFNVLDALTLAAKDTVRFTSNTQHPEYVTNQPRLDVQSQPPMAVNLRVVDAELSVTGLGGAEVSLDGAAVRKADAQGRLRFADVTPGTHTLKLRAKGYTGRETSLTLPAIAGTLAVTVPLLPGFVELVGQAPNAPEGTPVLLTSAKPRGFIAGYHQERTTIKGARWALRLPAFSGTLTLKVGARAITVTSGKTQKVRVTVPVKGSQTREPLVVSRLGAPEVRFQAPASRAAPRALDRRSEPGDFREPGDPGDPELSPRSPEDLARLALEAFSMGDFERFLPLLPNFVDAREMLMRAAVPPEGVTLDSIRVELATLRRDAQAQFDLALQELGELGLDPGDLRFAGLLPSRHPRMDPDVGIATRDVRFLARDPNGDMHGFSLGDCAELKRGWLTGEGLRYDGPRGEDPMSGGGK